MSFYSLGQVFISVNLSIACLCCSLFCRETRIVNRALPSLLGGSLEITYIVHLRTNYTSGRRQRTRFPMRSQIISGQRYIYTGCASGRVVIYDVLTGEIVQVKIVTQFY